jgi:hypothetical protein
MIIISGMQTGADQAALFAAEACGISTGGWCPIGGKTEVGPKPDLMKRFHLKEIGIGYSTRTRYNVSYSDMTIWFGRVDSPGFRATQAACHKYKKPLIIISSLEALPADTLGSWLAKQLRTISILNVAGNRESKNPGIYYYVYRAMRTALWAM